MMFTVADFLKQLQAASDKGRREKFKPFFSYDPEKETLEIYLSPKEGLNVQIGPNIEMQVDGGNREEILGFRFTQLRPPPIPTEQEVPF
jgi:hypothetical protein